MPRALTAVVFSLLLLAARAGAASTPPSISSISFRGNHAISSNTLSGLIRSQVGAVLDSTVLASDVEAIAAAYRAQGFLFATVEAAGIQSAGDSLSAQLTFGIDEGTRGTVSSLSIEGNTKFTVDELTVMMETRKGKALNKDVLERDLDGIVRMYEQSGYPFAAVTIEKIAPAADSTGLDIAITVSEGRLVHIDQVHARGNTETSEHVIVREAAIRPGSPYDARITESAVRRLKRTNLFSAVSDPEIMTDDSGKGTMTFPVTEGSTNTFDGVLGYVPASTTAGSEGYATGLVNISMGNLFGTGRKLAFRWQKDDRLSQELSAKYLEPWVLDFPVDLTLGFAQRQQDTTYIRRSTSVGTSVRVADQIMVGGSVSIESVIPSSTAAAFLGASRTTLTGLELKYDSRDNLLAPRAGLFYQTLYHIGKKSTDATLIAAGSSSTVQRIAIDAEGYAELMERQIAALAVHARQLNSGAIELGDLYRFGGATTLRGYRENQFLGSRVAWANAEYRLLLARASYVFGFGDFGYYFTPDNPAAALTGGSAYKTGYGLGIRLETSLGIIGVSFALGEGDGFSQTKVHINLINSF